MKFGMVHIFPPRAALDKLRLAEELGFDTFWVCDSHVIWNECYSLLGWLLASSRDDQMRFGTMVTNPVSRDPLVVASAFATLQDLSGGRMMCGIGRGDSAVRLLKRRPAKVADFEAAVARIRALTAGQAVDLEGGATALMSWAAGGEVPVYVAAYGARVMRAAGRAASGLIMECADPAYISWALGHVRAGAAETGRDLSDFAVIASTATYVTGDLDLAIKHVRPFGAVVGNHIAEVMRNTGAASLPPDLEAFIAGRPDYDYYQHVHSGTGQADYVPDEIIERLCIVGPRERCLERLAELRDAGVTHVNFYGQTPDYAEQMGIYARDLIPAFRGGTP